jgi:hypothetical protein
VNDLFSSSVFQLFNYPACDNTFVVPANMVVVPTYVANTEPFTIGAFLEAFAMNNDGTPPCAVKVPSFLQYT